MEQLKSQGKWSGKWTFILAATGSAVGLGNIWGFPYMAGTNGGGAFVLIYLACIVVIGLPIMMAEIVIGRRASSSPVNSMKSAALDSNKSSNWQLIGWGGLVAGILILSFYSVLAGICINYVFISALPDLQISSEEQFSITTSSASNLLIWHTIFIFVTAGVIASGIKNGIGRFVRILMPLLGFILILMVLNAFINGDFLKGLQFLFSPDFSQVNPQTFLSAMGQAFFSLSLGMGAIMTYGAYMSDDQKILNTSITVGGLDTLVALMAGLAIFPIIFASGLEVNSGGVGLVFITLSQTFETMFLGQIFGPLFFILLVIASLSSSISLLEPSVAYFSEKNIISRKNAAFIFGFLAWFLGIGSVLSFNVLSDFHLLGDRTILDSIVFIGNNLLLPLGGLFVAIFVGWFMKKELIQEQLQLSKTFLNIWFFFIRFVAPIAVGAILITQI
jgi:NSS family neurotransmitter:Na+ symporter